jgi:hypothetical protein
VKPFGKVALKTGPITCDQVGLGPLMSGSPVIEELSEEDPRREYDPPRPFNSSSDIARDAVLPRALSASASSSGEIGCPLHSFHAGIVFADVAAVEVARCEPGLPSIRTPKSASFPRFPSGANFLCASSPGHFHGRHLIPIQRFNQTYNSLKGPLKPALSGVL